MRIIAGEMRGQRLKSVPGNTTRPTSDKIKEAIFHRIGPFFSGGKCLDLFAGSGSLGLESLSRGMDKAVFVDITGAAIKTVRQNIDELRVKDKTEVYRNDAFRALDLLDKNERTFDLIMLDPPYEKINDEKLLRKIASSTIMNEGCIIYYEHTPNNPLQHDDCLLDKIYEKSYGTTTAITLFKKK